MPEKEIKPLYDVTYAAVMGELLDSLRAGTMTEEAFREDFKHEVWLRVNEQIDLHYQRKVRPKK